MQTEQAEEYLKKSVKIILSNGFHFTGTVIDVSGDTLVLIDKFNERVSLGIKDIMVCSGVASNGF